MEAAEDMSGEKVLEKGTEESKGKKTLLNFFKQKTQEEMDREKEEREKAVIAKKPVEIGKF